MLTTLGRFNRFPARDAGSCVEGSQSVKGGVHQEFRAAFTGCFGGRVNYGGHFQPVCLKMFLSVPIGMSRCGCGTVTSQLPLTNW